MLAFPRLGALLLPTVLLCAHAARSDGNLLRLVPSEMDVSAIIRSISEQQLPVSGIIVDVCRAGQTLFPVEGSVFRVRQGFEAEDRLAQWIEQAHAAGLTIYAGTELWLWWMPEWNDRDPFLEQPELLEVDEAMGQRVRDEVKYASPWHPRVCESFVALARTLATRYPALDGLYLRPTLSMETWLGFSDSAREAYRNRAGVDPVTIPVWGVKVADSPDLADWIAWRLDYLAERVREVRRTWEQAGGKGRVIARTLAAIPTWHKRYQGISLQNWYELASREAVTDLALDTELTKEGIGVSGLLAGWKYASEWDPWLDFLLVLPGEQRNKVLDYASVWERFVGQWDRWPELPILFDPARPESLPIVFEVLASLGCDRE